MTTGSNHTTTEPDPLPTLRRDFPAYVIVREPPGMRGPGVPPRFIATVRHPGPQPHTAVTADPSELRAALATHTSHRQRPGC